MNWSKRQDGMPAAAQGLTGAKAVLAPTMIRLGLGGDKIVEVQRRMIDAGGSVLVLAAPDSFAGWLDAGRTYEWACLQAVANRASISSFAAVSEVDAVAKELRDTLLLEARPMALLRVGVPLIPGEPVASLRRMVTVSTS